MAERYLLKSEFQAEWQEVTKEDWIKAERAAGFRPKCASTDPKYMTTPATGGWFGAGVSGRIEHTR